MKAFASDFDGTLYFENIEGGYKEEDLKKIKDFQDNGNYFGICTGRPIIGVEKNLEGKVNLDFYIVTSGAIIFDKNKNILFKKIIEKEIMLSLYNMYKDITNVMVQSPYAVYTFKIEGVNLVQTMINDINEVKDEITGMSLNAYSEENAQRICKEIKYYYHDLDAFQNKNFIDVVAKGCSKGNAVKLIKELLNVDTVVGMGDSYNDIPMLEKADISFTFHNSPDNVKQKATYIVDSIYEAIEKI